jgi:tetratricopeptide (TPR) repeat protein
MKKLFILIFFSIAGIHIYAGELEDVLQKANTLYNAERYEEASSLYQQLVDSDIVSAKLYYNLGNAYYKNDQIPQAIYYYEKAKKWDPGNEDIIHNLEVANQKIVDKPELVPELFFESWWKAWLRFFSANQWAIISLILFNAIFLLASVFFLSRSVRSKKMSFYGGLIIAFISLFSFYFSYKSYEYAVSHDEAIVFSPSVVVKSSPNDKSVDLFVIHEGLKIKLIENEGDWSKIRIGNGKIGWIPKQDYRKI